MAVWNDTVTRLPADCPRETHALLTEYCRAVTWAKFIGAAVDEFQHEWLAFEGGVERFAKLVATAGKAIWLMAALARALRITNQSRLKSETAARQAARDDGGPKPWDG